MVATHNFLPNQTDTFVYASIASTNIGSLRNHTGNLLVNLDYTQALFDRFGRTFLVFAVCLGNQLPSKKFQISVFQSVSTFWFPLKASLNQMGCVVVTRLPEGVKDQMGKATQGDSMVLTRAKRARIDRKET